MNFPHHVWTCCWPRRHQVLRSLAQVQVAGSARYAEEIQTYLGIQEILARSDTAMKSDSGTRSSDEGCWARDVVVVTADVHLCPR